VINGRELQAYIGLCVKNYRDKKLSALKITDECNLFNRRFEGTGTDGRLNILVICCTNYSERINSDFKKQQQLQIVLKPDKKFTNIHEVILLDLSDPVKRAKFFDVGGALSKHLETVVEKPQLEMADKA
jgi:hypothetical protein